MNPSVGVIIGRFQVDEITEGHLELIRAVVGKHEHLCLLLGTAASPIHRDNPLTFTIRKQMLESEFPTAIVMPLFDRQTDEMWSADVDRLLASAFPGQRAVLYGGRQSFIPHYHGRHPTRELDFGADTTSGTERRALIATKIVDDPKFRAGVITALHSLPPQSVPCVDIAVIKPTGAEPAQILLGRKTDEIGLRLPGGHVDVTDADYRAAAKRELFEETGLVDEGGLRYVGSFAVDDWRMRGRKDIKYFSSLFVMYYHHGVARGADDLADLDWYTFADAERLIIDFHRPLLLAACDHHNRMRRKGTADV